MEEGINEWVFEFASQNQAIMYAIFALDVQTLNLLGRSLPAEAQRDSGLLIKEPNGTVRESSDFSPSNPFSTPPSSNNSKTIVIGSKGVPILEKSSKDAERRRKRKRDQEGKLSSKKSQMSTNNDDDDECDEAEIKVAKLLSKISGLQTLAQLTKDERKRAIYLEQLEKAIGLQLEENDIHCNVNGNSSNNPNINFSDSEDDDNDIAILDAYFQDSNAKK
jgi:hypothetical protein